MSKMMVNDQAPLSSRPKRTTELYNNGMITTTRNLVNDDDVKSNTRSLSDSYVSSYSHDRNKESRGGIRRSFGTYSLSRYEASVLSVCNEVSKLINFEDLSISSSDDQEDDDEDESYRNIVAFHNQDDKDNDIVKQNNICINTMIKKVNTEDVLPHGEGGSMSCSLDLSGSRPIDTSPIKPVRSCDNLCLANKEFISNMDNNRMVVQSNGNNQRTRTFSHNDVSNMRKHPYTRSPWNKSDSDCYEIDEKDEINDMSTNSILSMDISQSQMKRQKFSQQRHSLDSPPFISTTFVSPDHRPLVPTRSSSGDKFASLQQCASICNKNHQHDINDSYQDYDMKKLAGSYSLNNVQTLVGYKVPPIIHDVDVKTQSRHRSMTESNLSYYGYNSPDSKPIMPTRSKDGMNEILMVKSDTSEETSVVDSYVKPTQRRRSLTESSLIRGNTSDTLDFKPVKPTRSYDEIGQMSSSRVLLHEEWNMPNEEWNMPNHCHGTHSQYHKHSSISKESVKDVQNEEFYATVTEEFHCNDEEISNEPVLFEAMVTNYQTSNNMEEYSSLDLRIPTDYPVLSSSSKKAKLHDDDNIGTHQTMKSMKRFSRRCSLDSYTKRECIVTNQSIKAMKPFRRRLSLELCNNLTRDCIITNHQTTKSIKRLICRRRNSLESSCSNLQRDYHHQTSYEGDSIHNKKKRFLWSRSIFHRLTTIKV